MRSMTNVDFPAANNDLVLSFCSGGGGLDAGVRLALPTARTVGYVEIEIPAIVCLVAHMEKGALDPAPLWTDLRTFDSGRWRGCVDGIIGGYPCQPFSVAGKKLGNADPRHLWPVIREHIRAIEPRWCFFENVANHLRIGFADVARDLHSLGYDVAATLITAAEVGAPHKRERLFILAHSRSSERDGGCSQSPRLAWVQHPAVNSTTLVDTDESGLEGRIEPVGCIAHELPAWPPGPTDDAGWSAILNHFPDVAPAIESNVRRMAPGMAARVDRLRLLGNGVVPLQAAHAFVTLWQDLHQEAVCRDR